MAVATAKDVNEKNVTLIGTSEPGGYMRPGVNLRYGEVIVGGKGHAETNIIDYAERYGLQIVDIGATRPVCANCALRIEVHGANIVTPIK